MIGIGRVAIGALAGAALAGFLAPCTRGWFRVPDGGVGIITVAQYPKGWDYAVVAMLILGAFAGGVLASWWGVRRDALPQDPTAPRRWVQLAGATLVFVTMLLVHDHPYAPMDPFHEGEHLTAGWLMKNGERPYGDFYIFHGLAVDAGIDAIALGDPPSVLQSRRFLLFLNALTLALLVPIAAELTATSAGLVAAVLASLSASAALWLPVFPYFRLAPLLIAVWALLRYARNGRTLPLFAAFAAATLGVLWSLDVGLYTLAGTAGAFILLRVFGLEMHPARLPRVLALGAVALLLPLIVLVAVGADLARFFVDSFVVMPKAIDPIWALPAPEPLTANGVRYYAPPIFYGFALALGLLAWRRGDRRLAAQIAIVIVFSILLFRSASGRVSWGHTRFAVPLLGIAVVAFVVEPLFRRRRLLPVAAAALLSIPLFVYFEIRENVVAGAKYIAGWRSRQSTEGLVPYPGTNVRGFYTSPQNVSELAALRAAIDAVGQPGGTILDFSNERALHLLMDRKPATRVMEISMLSVPGMLAEAMAELNANPPIAVVVRGDPNIAAFDGVSNAQRVPDLAAWIDANYPKRTEIGRFVLATR